jgi:hypothetical protein
MQLIGLKDLFGQGYKVHQLSYINIVQEDGQRLNIDLQIVYE